MRPGGDIDPLHYEEADKEFNDSRQSAMWIKQLAIFDGDEQKARYGYIRNRAADLAATVPVSTPLVSTFAPKAEAFPGYDFREPRVRENGKDLTGAVWLVLVGGWFALWGIRAAGYFTLHYDMLGGPRAIAVRIADSVGSTLLGNFSNFLPMAAIHVIWLILARKFTLEHGSASAKTVVKIATVWLFLVFFAAFGSTLEHP